MKFKADLAYQNRYTIVKDCEIEKTIRLSREEFNAFSDDLLAARDFIRENKDSMFRGDDNVFHCILVTGEEHEDGVLVYADGRDYANYACHVPDAKALLTVSQSSSLTGLCEKLSAFADYIAAESLTRLKTSDSAALYLAGLAKDFDIEMESNDTMWDTAVGMVGERLEGHGLDIEFDNGDLIVTPSEPEMQMGM